MGPSTKLRGSSPPLDTNTASPGCTGRPRVRAAYAVQPCPRYAARSGRLSSTFPHDVIGTVAPQSKTPGFGALRTLLIGRVCISPLVEFTRPTPGEQPNSRNSRVVPTHRQLSNRLRQAERRSRAARPCRDWRCRGVRTRVCTENSIRRRRSKRTAKARIRMTDLFKLILGILASRFKARATLEAENLVLRQQVSLVNTENLNDLPGPIVPPAREGHRRTFSEVDKRR